MTDTPDYANDPVFADEQRHLSRVYAALSDMDRDLVAKLERLGAEAALDKRIMSEELAVNFASDGEALETYVEFSGANRVIDAYNIAQGAAAEKLSNVRLLLREPYFAKVSLRFKPDAPAKDLYIGAAGVSDDDCRRLVVDWRSPVAEVYYNQENGPTSYVANGRTIEVDLECRRQFDIEEDRLNAYFDTTVAIEDPLLLKSLSKQRSEHMTAITATIQKEQNTVIRHEDVPALLVAGIAGSGKTSVMLQRIAYLFYRRRDDLDPREVFLISPNPVFSRYIERVLPDMGERNPETLTWAEFAARLMPAGHSASDTETTMELLARIDAAVASLEFEQDDFKELRVGDVRLLSTAQIRQVSEKYARFPVGPHRVALMREDLESRIENRLSSMAGTEAVLDELSVLPFDEQLRLFHETIDPQTDEEARKYALIFLRDRFAPAIAAIERDEWLRIDRIGMRALDIENLPPTAWIYLKMAVTGLSNPHAKYVMVDEVQDYTPAQLHVLARYFSRAHFLLLGDESQAIKDGTATFSDVRAVFEADRGQVETCSLMTSYRSTPEVTELFARLLPTDVRPRVASVQRDGEATVIEVAADDAAYADAIRRAAAWARETEGLAAVIAPWKHEARRIQTLLGDDAPPYIMSGMSLPPSGAVLITLELAKGLEFDRIVVPDASPRVFPAGDDLARRRLYTTISRATRGIRIVAREKLTPLLADR